MTTPATPPVDPYGATTPLPQAAAGDSASTAPTPRPRHEPIETRGLSLTAKIFLAVAGTVLLVLIGTLLVGGASSQRAAQNSLDAALHQTADLITSQLASDEQNMSAKGLIFFANTDLRSGIERLGDSAAEIGRAHV